MATAGNILPNGNDMDVVKSIHDLSVGRRIRQNKTAYTATSFETAHARRPRYPYKRRRWTVRNSSIHRTAATFVILASLVTTLTVCASRTSSQARTLEVGPGKPFAFPSEAAAVTNDGDHIEIAAGTYVDCAVWRSDHLVIEGIEPGVVISDRTCLGKGLFVIIGHDVTVRNLTLARARVPNKNGAGIRQEGRNLTVERVKFFDNENGILSNSFANSSVIIRDSEFERNGRCAEFCAHGVYFGKIAMLRLEHSRFFETQQGHHIKSRAARTEVVDNQIADGAIGTSSYLIDAPDGGSLMVRGNNLEKGPRSENPRAAIAIGEESLTQPTEEIIVEKNVLKNDGNYETALIWNVTATPARLKENTLIGPIVPIKGEGEVRR